MNNYPLIKFVLFFICGILLQNIFHVSVTGLLYISALLFSSTFLLFFIKKEYLAFPKNILIISTIISIGGLYHSTMSDSKSFYSFELPKYQNAVIYGSVEKVELIKKERLTMIVSADSILLPGNKFYGKINLLYNIKDSNRKLKKVYNEIGIGNKVEVTGRLTRPRDKRNPGEYNYELYLAEKQIAGLVNSYDAEDIIIKEKTYSLLGNVIFSARKSIDELISKIHNKTTSALLRGLILADRSLIDYEIRQEFVNAGVVHVLAVSGLHVGFIVLIFLFLFQRFNIYARIICTIAGLLLFMLITDSPPSVTRATIMSIALLLGPITGRSYKSINAMALAAFIILLINPNELFNPGFQLSFSAVLAIVIFYPPFSAYIKERKIKSKAVNYVLLFSITSLAAQIGTVPFTLIYFEKLSIVALLTNLLVIPLIGCVVGLGIFTLFISSIIPQIGFLFVSANELLTYILFRFVNISGHNSISYLPVYNYSFYDAIIFYTVLGGLFLLWEKLENISAKIIAVVLFILLLFIYQGFDDYKLMPDGKLSIMAIDIGQGDSFLIKFPNGKTALIDAGEATENFDNGKRIILPLLNRLGISKIDYGFISHVDSDHYKGFLSLIKEGRISKIYKPKIDSSLARDIELERFLRAEKIPFWYYSKEYLSVGNARLYILNDTTDLYFEKFSSNDKSGVMKLVYGNTSFLFTGDAGVKPERYFVGKYGKFLKSDLLKAGHHGSKTSTSDLFLNTVSPGFAIISAGVANKFNHPHKDVIAKLKKHNINILRTDESGAVLLYSNGKNIQNINWKNLESGFIF